LGGACEFYTHAQDIPGLHPSFPPSEGIGGGRKERGSLAFLTARPPSASQLQLA